MTAVQETLTKEQMDRLVDGHYRAEMAGDVDAAIGSFAADIIHDVVGSPGVLHTRVQAAAMYSDLFQQLAIQNVEPVRRLYGETFVVDEAVVDARVPGMLMGIAGKNRPVRFRLLHIFEFRDGLIARENAWLDVAGIYQQLG